MASAIAEDLDKKQAELTLARNNVKQALDEKKDGISKYRTDPWFALESVSVLGVKVW